MKSFDATVVGAGPAGGHLARLMAKSGYSVLLVEQYDDFSKNDYSSAGTVLSTLERFELPEHIVGSYWKNLVAVTTSTRKTWRSPENLGAVLDFAKLKEFLANDVKDHGGDVWMGYRYLKHSNDDGRTVVTFKQVAHGELASISTRVLVDATGAARAVISDKEDEQQAYLTATGLEYLIEVNEEAYNQYAKSIVFFLGHKWMPKGYSWVFPMEEYRLKVGAGRFNLEHRHVTHIDSLKHYIQLLIDKDIKPAHYDIIDIHGSTIKYSQGLKDIYYNHNTIAIGDAVSTVNPLGGEGIRHGMHSAEIAVTYIKRYLENEILDFRDYQIQMRQHFLSRWDSSARTSIKRYIMETDSRIDKAFMYLGQLTTKEVIEVLFYYKRSHLRKGIFRYIKGKIFPNLRRW